MSLTYKVKSDYLEIIVTGGWSWELALKAQAEAARLVGEHDLGGVLVDCRQAVLEATLTEIYEFTKLHAKVFPPHVRHAAVGIDAPKRNKFYEDVAANRGMSHRVFAEIDEARDWLSSPATGTEL